MLLMTSLAACCVLLTTDAWFRWSVAPRAVDRWAIDQGYKIATRKRAGIFQQLRSGSVRGQVVFEIVFRDGSGKSRMVLVNVGRFWWQTLDVERCPVRIGWEEPTVPDQWSE